MGEQNGNNGTRKIVPFYAMKLRDAVRPTCALRVKCYSCKHETVLDAVELIHLFGPLTSLAQIEKKTMRCTQCRSTFNSMQIEWL